ncbi:hypothetical protein [Paracoccus litorisediminis]|uniref:Uncharacterized protein n=1 Tax=Paracoccus litorisediminis TaxID=2006130 RepID=A0A844HGE9_9RHOB|nr:hypothetical protein [Paracoccus litorisediminis]MTH59003.1 hypothetical protein [Paracoccus litorisediminis]
MDKRVLDALVGLRYRNSDDAMREIAKLVREGCTEPIFVRVLADLLDPGVKTTSLGAKFRLARTTGKKAPPKKPNYELRIFLERFLDIFPDEEPAEAVKAEAARRFNVSRSTCGEEIATMRKWQELQPDEFESRKADALLLRELGDPDYLPLWPDK